MVRFVSVPFVLSAVALANAQLSIPSLIPKIGNITDILYDLLPDLPILQLPLPPLDSPPFTPSDLKPKEVGYFWTGSGDRRHKDFIATYSLDKETFGTLIYVTDVPTSGNEPHHLGMSMDGKTLLGSGLLSLLKTQDTAYFFDLEDPYRPKFIKSNRALLASIADEIRAIPGGGFYMTYMGSLLGTDIGRLVEFDKNFDIIGQYPEDLSILNTLTDQFTPHGLAVDFGKGKDKGNDIALTSDFVIPLTTLKPVSALSGIVKGNTLRLWDLKKKTIISTIKIPDGGGIQDVKFIPGNKEKAAVATAVHLGQVWIIYPYRKDRNGNQGVAELLYDLGPKARDTTAIYTDLTEDGKFIYASITTGNHVAALDISDLKNVKRLDDPDEDQHIIGPHSVRVTPDQKHVVVTGYFVQEGSIGSLNTPADFKAHYYKREKNGSLTQVGEIDFTHDFKSRGGGRPHFSAVLDLSVPGVRNRGTLY